MPKCTSCLNDHSSERPIIRTSANIFICETCARLGLSEIQERQICEVSVQNTEHCSICDFEFPGIKCSRMGTFWICLFDLFACLKVFDERSLAKVDCVLVANGLQLKPWQPIICRITENFEHFDEAVLVDYPEVCVSFPLVPGSNLQIGQEVPAFFVAMTHKRLLAFPNLPNIINGPWAWQSGREA